MEEDKSPVNDSTSSSNIIVKSSTNIFDVVIHSLCTLTNPDKDNLRSLSPRTHLVRLKVSQRSGIVTTKLLDN